MADDLAELEPYLAAYLNRLGPAQRPKVLRKVGESARKLNTARIAANVQPDGAPMEPRKKHKRMKDAKGRIKRQGKMFRKLRLARKIAITTGGDEVSLSFKGNAEESASRHHFGLVGFVGNSKRGNEITAKFPERRLLGFGPEDLEIITSAALDMLDG